MTDTYERTDEAETDRRARLFHEHCTCSQIWEVRTRGFLPFFALREIMHAEDCGYRKALEEGE